MASKSNSDSSTGSGGARKIKKENVGEGGKDPTALGATVESATFPGNELRVDESAPLVVEECNTGKGSFVPNGAGDNEKLPASSDQSKSKKKSKKKKNTTSSAFDQVRSEASLSATPTNSRLPNPISSAIPICSKSSLEEELDWCVLQLELGMLKQTAAKSQKEQNQKNIRTFQSTKTPFPKKRQLMRSLFGDYRSKMKRQSTSMLLLEKSRLIAKETKVETVKPEVLEGMGTYFRKKTEKIRCNDVGGAETRESFKFNFTVPS